MIEIKFIILCKLIFRYRTIYINQNYINQNSVNSTNSLHITKLIIVIHLKI